MSVQNLKTAKNSKRKELQATVIDGSPVSHDGSGITKSNFDRKADEMKAFLKRNPVPKEFLK